MSTTEIEEIYSFVAKLRQKLWCGREFGQAAVMVGAGFSRNAEPLSETARPFPLWWDLAETMKREIYYTGPGATGDSIRKAPTDALKLATLYECMFDRHALDDLLIKSIPEDSHRPGRLHELLMSLPWSDVFTTNYDTLLERAARKVFGRKYEVVTKASDISRQMKPRIIKLHGSFPAPPFIITEEDFRTYPAAYPPFVNLVQQAIMESALCMIGFSGEDPNFLHWTGWVRDNLGTSAPPIYYCGVLDLHPSAKRVLSRRNIVPIDLGIMFPVSSYPIPETRHRLALEWLLLSLLNGQTPSVRDWPKPGRGKNWQASSGLLTQPLPQPEPIPPIGDRMPHPATVAPSKETLLDICRIWRNTRENYPGWVIAPFANRRTLWEHTQYWIGPIMSSLDKLDAPADIEIIFEMVWRLRKSLIPLDNEISNLISSVLEKYDPFPSIGDPRQAPLSPNLPASKAWDWGHLGHVWVELRISLLKFARAELDLSKFEAQASKVEPFACLRPEWQQEVLHERCLLALCLLDYQAVRSHLAAWPLGAAGPSTAIKRAAILAELGDSEEAEQVLQRELDSIRTQEEPFVQNLKLFSQEGWLLLLLRAIRSRSLNDNVNYMDRLEELAVYKCNPWDEIHDLQAEILRVKPRNSGGVTVRDEFDPGVQTISHSFGGVSEYERLFSPLNTASLFMEVGLPLRMEGVKFFSDLVIESARLTSDIFPLLAITTLIRTGDKDQIKEWFGRSDIAVLSSEKAALIADICMRRLTDDLTQLTGRRHVI